MTCWQIHICMQVWSQGINTQQTVFSARPSLLSVLHWVVSKDCASTSLMPTLYLYSLSRQDCQDSFLSTEQLHHLSEMVSPSLMMSVWSPYRPWWPCEGMSHIVNVFPLVLTFSTSPAHKQDFMTTWNEHDRLSHWLLMTVPMNQG